MATFLFWNIMGKWIPDQIAALCHERNVDVLILAESTIPPESLVRTLNEERGGTFLPPLNPSPYLSFFTKERIGRFEPVLDDGRVSIRRLVPPGSAEILVAAVHLRSKLHDREANQDQRSTIVFDPILKAEQAAGHSRTVVVGDFNMNPFERGIVGARGLHAVMDRQIARKKKRTVEGKEYTLFYNPMWSRLGDASKGPPGTYYYNDSSYVNYFWHTFDQVILRPELLDYFSDEKLEVVTEIAGRSLLTPDGIPDSARSSDHLPLLFALNIEEGT